MDAIESLTSTSASASSDSRPSSRSSAPPSEPSTLERPSSLPAGAPVSPFFEIRQTPNAGRAVFATQAIPKDTLIWRSDDLTLSVLLREYRREVCGQCFNYEHGRDLDVRDKTVGFAFCTPECQEKWRHDHGEVGIQAWTAVESLVKGRSKEDNEMMDLDLPRPKPQDITAAWESVAAQAAIIRAAREISAPTKQHRKAISKALQSPISPDVMSFCVSGLLWPHAHPETWPSFLALADDDTPYHNFPDLSAFTRTYLHLLSILPVPLLPFITAESLFLLSCRDSHNSFGIRSLEDDGSEFFGYGCWPAASYFNHSCGPNVEKKRVGRSWEFRVNKQVEVSDELCITYLSGEERKLSREKRNITLKRNWGFECACRRCKEDI
ncbi:SET domain-containing protein [Phaeosphaeriaceae sp. SRC1lsM3a]|nr:SET domain-containing protein [Stagonospora sp. SRC1lsM3a]